jgi:hypothetical protein
MGNAGYGNHTQDYGDAERTDPAKERQTSSEKDVGKKDQAAGDTPPAGPHADPSLTNPDATPGAGTLTPPGQHDDVDSTSG